MYEPHDPFQLDLDTLNILDDLEDPAMIVAAEDGVEKVFDKIVPEPTRGEGEEDITYQDYEALRMHLMNCDFASDSGDERPPTPPARRPVVVPAAAAPAAAPDTPALAMPLRAAHVPTATTARLPPFKQDGLKDTRRWLKAVSQSHHYGANPELKHAKTGVYMNRMYWKSAGFHALKDANEHMCRLLCHEFHLSKRAPRCEINTFQFPTASDTPQRLAEKTATWNSSFNYFRSFVTFLNDFYARNLDALGADLELVQDKVQEALERRRLTGSRTGSFRVMFAVFEQYAAMMAVLGDGDNDGGDGGGGGEDGDGHGGDEGARGGGTPGRGGHAPDDGGAPPPDGGAGGDSPGSTHGDGGGGPSGGRDGGETDGLGDGDSSDDSDDDDDDAESVRRDVEDMKAGIARALAPIKDRIYGVVDRFMKGVYHDLKSNLFSDERHISPKALRLFRRQISEKFVSCQEELVRLGRNAMLLKAEVILAQRRCTAFMEGEIGDILRHYTETALLHENPVCPSGEAFTAIQTALGRPTRDTSDSTPRSGPLRDIPRNVVKILSAKEDSLFAKGINPEDIKLSKGITPVSDIKEWLLQDTCGSEAFSRDRDVLSAQVTSSLEFGDFKIYSVYSDSSDGPRQFLLIYARMILVKNIECMEYLSARYTQPPTTRQVDSTSRTVRNVAFSVGVAGAFISGPVGIVVGGAALAVSTAAAVVAGSSGRGEGYERKDCNIENIEATVIKKLIDDGWANIGNNSLRIYY